MSSNNTNHDTALYLTAEQAAEQLGISVTTLYAYVSRKNIRSVKVEGSRSRRYWAQDIERLSSNKINESIHPPSINEHVISNQSGITLITEQGIYYRGKSVIELAETATIEEVAAFLWEQPDIFNQPALEFNQQAIQLLDATSNLSPIEQAISLFSFLEYTQPHAYDLSPQGYARTGVDALRSFAAIIVNGKPENTPLHQYLAKHLNLDEPFHDLLRRQMILSVDHELDPTTFAVRAAAQTGITPYGAAISGLVAYRGRHINLVRINSVTQLIKELCTANDPCVPILNRYRQDEVIPGYDKNIHDIADPRADHLLEAMSSVLNHDPDFLKLLKANQMVFDLTGKPPGFILLSAFLGFKFGLISKEMAFVGLSRLVGWIAHACEQYHQGPNIRARANYVGSLPIDKER